ncbi:MAG: hypothetical protein RMM28_11440 [Thermoleophilia bacterium]|nr:hypothetical protein [Thermoleophilia bacterium]
MGRERRTEADIRAEIAAEREQLVSALRDLRTGVASKRRPATAVGVLVAAGVGLVVLHGIARRLRG